MDPEEIGSPNIIDGAVQEIDNEGSFINIVGYGNYKFSNILQEIEVYGDTPSDMFIERARYLLSADEMIEEMLGM
ncbi:MAG: hypothetical protein O8C66_03750 [Candidatus Methanoperedens sp.]|nr:hypothetical protein [Candidatus Methanoperedens sp.]MCZ7369601.1 hypothetical protein [Candidatus Methanoperedens sp.]